MGALDEVRDLAEAVARRRSLMLWDVEVGGAPGRMIVRVLIDAEGGVDLDTVAEVSEEISRGLDLKDPIGGRYTLEVSSPGLERKLKSPEHFRAVVGEKVVVKTQDRLVEESNRVEGEVLAAAEEAVTLATDSGDLDVPYAQIRSARTVFEWNR